ncbi:hypothetical protein GM658_01140 [Pseudoduganella eburnea]|uniref:Uncharacterized protein n=1 Tax=Massilia eburnea TaxID=1776165 RepID=A0A6L6QAV3_9BURK|nr:hypothetical protein [Massilia eburnea]MTW09194.1 hypothetical protein [Massilia eburnea]
MKELSEARMKSYWSVVSQGVALAIVLKKLERLLAVHFESVELEQVTLDGKKLEKADFFVELPHATQWSEMVLEMLGVSARLCPSWSVAIGTSSFSANYSPARDGDVARIAGLQSVNWEILQSQTFTRRKWQPAAKLADRN